MSRIVGKETFPTFLRTMLEKMQRARSINNIRILICFAEQKMKFPALKSFFTFVPMLIAIILIFS